jgi:hypothetical protein
MNLMMVSQECSLDMLSELQRNEMGAAYSFFYFRKFCESFGRV